MAYTKDRKYENETALTALGKFNSYLKNQKGNYWKVPDK